MFFRLIDCTDERRAVAEANRRTEAIKRENAELRRRIAALEQRHNDHGNP